MPLMSYSPRCDRMQSGAKTSSAAPFDEPSINLRADAYSLFPGARVIFRLPIFHPSEFRKSLGVIILTRRGRGSEE